MGSQRIDRLKVDVGEEPRKRARADERQASPNPPAADPHDHAPWRPSPVVALLDLERAARVGLAEGVQVGNRVV
jgi:hypothetical protein